MSTDDLVREVIDRHRLYKPSVRAAGKFEQGDPSKPLAPYPGYCIGCGYQWPCDARRLLDLLTTFQTALIAIDDGEGDSGASKTATRLARAALNPEAVVEAMREAGYQDVDRFA